MTTDTYRALMEHVANKNAAYEMFLAEKLQRDPATGLADIPDLNPALYESAGVA
jgi:hypothetical protein